MLVSQRGDSFGGRREVNLMSLAEEALLQSLGEGLSRVRRSFLRSRRRIRYPDEGVIILKLHASDRVIEICVSWLVRAAENHRYALSFQANLT